VTNLKTMKRLWSKMGIDFLISEYPNCLKFHRLVVDKKIRNTGLGTLFMNALTQYADWKNKRIDLRPDIAFGGSSIMRLKKFYKRFGFIENKGRNKISGISETMYRKPREEL